ncbi:unnamed protein product [Rhizophagus irregularis]|nr:unnamed protein product [Rhizophagus irregularis]
MIKPQTLAYYSKKILAILNNITKIGRGCILLIKYPMLIGFHVAKLPFFCELNDWNLIATPLQSTLFINKVKSSNKYEVKCDSDMNEEESNDNNNEDDNYVEDNMNIIEFERFNDIQPKISALTIFDLCCNIEDKMLFPLLSSFPCIVSPLKVLEALKTSQFIGLYIIKYHGKNLTKKLDYYNLSCVTYNRI